MRLFEPCTHSSAERSVCRVFENAVSHFKIEPAVIITEVFLVLVEFTDEHDIKTHRKAAANGRSKATLET